jgi:hypothetical protein
MLYNSFPKNFKENYYKYLLSQYLYDVLLLGLGSNTGKKCSYNDRSNTT